MDQSEDLPIKTYLIFQNYQDEMRARAEIQDVETREEIIENAFKEHRWVLFIKVKDETRRICFTPTRDEIDIFVSLYIVPFFLGSPGAFENSSWKKEYFISEYIPWRDVERIYIHAETEELRKEISNRLKEQLDRFRGIRAN